MAYTPPSSSKYTSSTSTMSTAPMPIVQDISKPFATRRRDADTQQDWSAFGSSKKRSLPPATDNSKAPTSTVDLDRNCLSAYLHQAIKDLPATTSGPKWEQSAIRRKPTVVPSTSNTRKTHTPDSTDTTIFPSLGGNNERSSPSGKKMEKSPSSLSLTFADRMRLRIQEEEAQKKRHEEYLADQASKQEEEERRNRMLGILKGGYMAKSAKRFEHLDNDMDIDCLEYEGGSDLEYNVYGHHYARNQSDTYDEHSNDEGLNEPVDDSYTF